MNSLSDDEKRRVWAETERNFWQRFDDENSFHRANSEAQYRTQTAGIENQLAELTETRTQLTDRQELLSKELTLVEERLARVAEACDNKFTELYILDQDYRKIEQQKRERRSQIATKMKGFFREKRELDRGASSEPNRQDFHDIVNNGPRTVVPNRDAVHAEALQQANEIANSTLTSYSVQPETSVLGLKPRNTLAHAVDCDGHVIGPIEEIEPWNHWVEEIREVPIKRQVKIRRGRKFNQNHLATIYDRSDPKGVKWIACMIQATGRVQQKRCHSCDKNQGVFEDCVILGGPLFPKCGNCEWNRQGCHMSVTTKTPSPITESNNRRPETLVLRGPPPTPAPPHPASGWGQSRSIDGAAYASHETTDCLEPVQLPTPKGHGFSNPLHQHDFHHHHHHHHHHQQQQQQQQQQNSLAWSGFTPVNSCSRPSSRGVPTPAILSAEHTPQTPTAEAEITRSNLVLRHNGVVYTYPECVQGVPLAKIDQGHPYWDPRWPSIHSIIAPQLDEWIKRHEKALAGKAKGETGSKKEQTLRQVNRGTTVLEYLEYGEISPYQLLSKKYTRSGKGKINAYDTVFRMCKTLVELANFRLDISPVEWLRHRLHEIILEDGDEFNYARTMHDFYHDSKFKALRIKNGFRSIGRPSGYRTRKSRGRRAKPNMPSTAKKRKQVHPQTPTPRATPSATRSPISPQTGEYIQSPNLIQHFNYPLTAEPKHMAVVDGLKTLSEVSAPLNDEFYADGFTDTDSWSGAPLEKLDWRVYQVKTRLFTSQTNVTQYWHWKEDKRVFEHQVLQDINPVVWGLLRAPTDFDIPLDDIVQVNWNIDALQVQLVMGLFGSSKMSEQDGKPRGDVMAAFKRETTMRRFLTYCRQRRLKLTKIAADDMEQRWATMQSETLSMPGKASSVLVK
ncbi:hypothetical protein E4U21_002752 [Claviceps maximensis]|nr:hypothetical protein E4U21_002752 [Claviceps maximensis]